jgi:hypothetical protein
MLAPISKRFCLTWEKVLDSVQPHAQKVGSVNVRVRDGKVAGTGIDAGPVD